MLERMIALAGRYVAVAALLLFPLSGCLPGDGRAAAEALMAGREWRRVTFDTGRHRLAGWLKPGRAESLTVYLEGDGRAFLGRMAVSPDPTPADPLALRLALADPAPLVLYLARPCQYLDLAREPACTPWIWTSGRFSPEALSAADAALDQARTLTGATRLRLVGYSGGGAMAVLLASRRSDVECILTVAGNLDHALWTTLHRVSPLDGSLNPADATETVRDIPQTHLVGADDRVVPPSVARSFLARIPSPSARLVVLPGFDHHRPWADEWPRLLREYLP